MSSIKCRFCGNLISHTFADLGTSPLANSYLKVEDLHKMEPFYPLHAYVCDNCLLVQLPEHETPEHIFSEYAYFSSYSDTWLKHAKSYSEKMFEMLGLDENRLVIEIGSNDGYLLKYFKDRGTPVLGIEPARNVAEAAENSGIRTVVKFFGVKTASELINQGNKADLLVGNNVLAHVPYLNDFIKGMKMLLKDNGVITVEFPHLMRLIEENQFDTIYHEHYSYFSLLTVENIFATHGLKLFDVEEIPTHGGSLRTYACHKENRSRHLHQRVYDLRAKEKNAGLTNIKYYLSFNENIRQIKRMLLTFLISAKKGGQSIVGYGAAAKGNTLLNFCGIGTDFIDYVVDRSPHKQGRFLPGTHIPIRHPEAIRATMPAYLLILPWNLKDEIMDQMRHIREWNGHFVVPIPKVKVL